MAIAVSCAVSRYRRGLFLGSFRGCAVCSQSPWCRAMGATRLGRSEKCRRLWASRGDGDSVITGFFGPYAVDILAAYIRYFSFYFNRLHHYEKLATSSAYGPIAQHFRPRRHLLSAAGYRAEMRSRFESWAEITGTKRAA